MQAAFAALAANVQARYGVPLATVGAMGVSGMMHGYLPFDAGGRQLAPLPHLAQHYHRPGRRPADRTFAV